MALSRDKKQEVLDQYKQWMDNSQAVVLVEYLGIKMADFDAIRAKVRDTGGEFHVVKNTLARKVLEDKGMTIPAGYLEKARRWYLHSRMPLPPPRR